jgi:hypothetical protein
VFAKVPGKIPVRPWNNLIVLPHHFQCFYGPPPQPAPPQGIACLLTKGKPGNRPAWNVSYAATHEVPPSDRYSMLDSVKSEEPSGQFVAANSPNADG